jgi:hypothetical protein
MWIWDEVVACVNIADVNNGGYPYLPKSLGISMAREPFDPCHLEHEVSGEGVVGCTNWRSRGILQNHPASHAAAREFSHRIPLFIDASRFYENSRTPKGVHLPFFHASCRSATCVGQHGGDEWAGGDYCRGVRVRGINGAIDVARFTVGARSYNFPCEHTCELKAARKGGG